MTQTFFYCYCLVGSFFSCRCFTQSMQSFYGSYALHLYNIHTHKFYLVRHQKKPSHKIGPQIYMRCCCSHIFSFSFLYADLPNFVLFFCYLFHYSYSLSAITEIIVLPRMNKVHISTGWSLRWNEVRWGEMSHEKWISCLGWGDERHKLIFDAVSLSHVGHTNHKKNFSTFSTVVLLRFCPWSH